MNVTSKIEHKSSIEADVAYTSYVWSLKHWSLLCDEYDEGITSPEFEIAHSKDCKCKLTFCLTEIHVQFISKFEFLTLRANVSVVDKNMKKLLTIKSPRMTSVKEPLILVFPEPLDEERSEYLEGDTLILFFELNVVKDFIVSSVRTNIWDSNFNSNAQDKLKYMFASSEFCDVTFIVEKQSIPAHKLIVAANSDVFHAMFMSQMKEQENCTVKIDDVKADVFKVFLRYMYTGKVDEIPEVVLELIVVADKYQVIDLMKTCESYMTAHLQIENATQYLLSAHQLRLTILEEEAVKFMKQNTQILADPTEYKRLSDYPSLITRIFG